jgi:hypothetical protein
MIVLPRSLLPINLITGQTGEKKRDVLTNDDNNHQSFHHDTVHRICSFDHRAAIASLAKNREF